MDKIKVGCIGMGQRGEVMIKTVLSMFENVDVAAVCDSYEDRAKKGAEIVKKYRGSEPFATTCPEDIMKMNEVQAVLIFTAWESHIDLTISAMEHGKYVGVEVGGAYRIEDCYKVIEAYNRTKIPCMMLENCCYGRKELAVLNMVRQGIFGEVVHCSGGYHHYLCDEIAGGVENRHYRLRNYLNRNCENYPTHELGPIAKVLNINRGNRMLTLSSFASKSRGLKSYVEENAEKYPHLIGKEFKQGDIITTVITCADGSTIVLTLDTTLPRAYSRGFTVRGTKGSYFEDNDSVFIESAGFEHYNWNEHWGNGKEYREKYMHPLVEKYDEKAKAAGHDGMDYMVLAAFFEAVEKKANPPIDVYDLATWMSVTTLSEESISKGGMPVSIPDFTGGKWLLYDKKDNPELEFSLD